MSVGQSAPTHPLCSPLWTSALPDTWKHFISLHTLTHCGLSSTSIISLLLQGKLIWSITDVTYQCFSLLTIRPVPLAFLLLLRHLRKQYIFVHCFFVGFGFFPPPLTATSIFGFYVFLSVTYLFPELYQFSFPRTFIWHYSLSALPKDQTLISWSLWP